MGLVLERDPDTVRGPDVALYLESRKFDELETKYPERMPKLVVDVLSPNDRQGKMLKRVKKFLEKGVAMVWLLDPEERTATVFLPDQTPIPLEGDEELTGYGVLPDFHCKTSDFFVMADE